MKKLINNIKNNEKTALVLGGGFIGTLAKRLKDEGFVRIVDIKNQHEFWKETDICDDYVAGDLSDPNIVENNSIPETFQNNTNNSFDEVAKLLAADMGGAGYIFTGEKDAKNVHFSFKLNIVRSAKYM